MSGAMLLQHSQDQARTVVDICQHAPRTWKCPSDGIVAHVHFLQLHHQLDLRMHGRPIGAKG